MSRLQGKIDQDGAIIIVQVGLGQVDAASLQATGQPVPAPFQTTALIDTGALQTAVAPMVLNHLGAPPTGSTAVTVPGQAILYLPLYDVRITVGTHQPPFEVQVVGVVPATHTVAVLIGRDILEQGALFFDSQNKAFSLWF